MISFILCFIMPPLAVYLSDASTTQFIINIILTAFGWFPGILHALYVVGNF
ncbi:YqaE/Pmp3 family membrane protein [Alphaproteobacteria bacterium]|nr:YqaE/Pmp3 family membrane protein [Alphaproteobacteria bacterium]